MSFFLKTKKEKIKNYGFNESLPVSFVGSGSHDLSPVVMPSKDSSSTISPKVAKPKTIRLVGQNIAKKNSNNSFFKALNHYSKPKI